MKDSEQQTRQQRMLARIANEKDVDWPTLVPRAESLPAMLIRHGVLPVMLFLTSKDKGQEKKSDPDPVLWRVVKAGIESVLPGYCSSLVELATLSLERYLLLQEMAIESATLVARWAKVQKAEGQKAKAPSGGGAP